MSAVLLSLAVLGVVGLGLWCAGTLPSSGQQVAPPSNEWQRLSRSLPAVAGATAGLSAVVVTAQGPATEEMERASEGASGSEESAYKPQEDAKGAARAEAARLAAPPTASGAGMHGRRGRGGCRNCCNSCNCNDMGSCDCNCNCGSCDGEGAMALLLIAFVIFVLIGVFVGIFFLTIAVQRIVQRHVHMLNMRTATQRFPVVDLGDDDPD